MGPTNTTADPHPPPPPHHHRHQHFRPPQLMNGDHHRDGADEDEPSSSGISCSICLDTVLDNGGRSRAKLQCGHEFHLDCIGSAFNMKGAMQCPNCRKVEKGQWLYANGSNRMLPEMSMDDWIPEEDFYDLSYSEMPYRVHWCPFGELARVGSSFGEVESPSTTYHDLRGHHSVYAEHTAASSVAHSYVAYVGPIPPNPSRSNDGIDDPNFNHHWNGLSGRHEIFSTHAFPAINIQYHNWGRRSPPFSVSSSHINGVDPASVPMTFRSSVGESDTRTRSTSFPHPIVFGHGSGPTAGSSFVSSIFPRHPGSGARTNERIQISHAFHRQQSSSPPGVPSPIIHGIRRFDGPRGLPTVVPAPPQHDHSGGFLIIPPSSSSQNSQEAENPLPNHFHARERERLPHFQHASFHQNTGGGPNPGNRSSSFWHRHSS
ncbi:E3 ubiquitin-protein ligase RFI2 [Ricinus communis]|uniref:DNA binding protein, putative n=1 Tax=Ricinus communis TaxID=3988 RepID=B9SAQ0_RICCO|nr:E3 ubiquitin-protein ligase RFI2 [Ricinus communis]EEF39254.1 DNA binding protein, putative [Ricinus communis]|eukprot:XP_002523069.1 E3 ubiquitin-protein ligase RFI2 [Ricinus communis]